MIVDSAGYTRLDYPVQQPGLAVAPEWLIDICTG